MKINSTREHFSRQAIRRFPIFYMTSFLFTGKRSGACQCTTAKNSLISNYINPIIGDMEVQAVTPRVVDGYIQTLQKTASVSTKTRKATTTYVSNQDHREDYKISALCVQTGGALGRSSDAILSTMWCFRKQSTKSVTFGTRR